MRRKKKQKLRVILIVLGITGVLLAHHYRSSLYYYWIVISDRTASGAVYSDFGQKSPHGFSVHGIDVSHHQGKIDWDLLGAMRSHGDSISFVFIKATEGRSFTDPYFRRNWERARELGLIRGAYHYYRPSVNSNHQARQFISKVSLLKGDLPPVLDIEDPSPFGFSNLRKGLLNWLRLVEAEYGIRPIIYTSAAYYRDYLSGTEFSDYPLWIAHYTGKRKPAVAAERWIFWQYSDKGKVSGSSEFTDLNVYKGGMEGLRMMTVQ